MSRWKVVFTVAIVTAAVAAGASFKIYLVTDGGGGDLVWSGSEAYVFANRIQRGYNWSYLEYPIEMLREYFYAAPLPANQRIYLSTFKITSAGHQDHKFVEGELTSNIPNFYTNVGQEIYAWCAGVVCRWTGDSFESVGSVEEQRIGGLSGLSSNDFAGVNGWSKHRFGSGPVDSNFTIKPNDTFEVSIVNHPSDESGHGILTINMLRPGRAPEGIWQLDGRPRRVTRAEYSSIFGRS